MVSPTSAWDRRAPGKVAPRSVRERVALSFLRSYPRLTLDFFVFLTATAAVDVPPRRHIYHSVGDREGYPVVYATAGPAAVHG